MFIFHVMQKSRTKSNENISLKSYIYTYDVEIGITQTYINILPLHST